MLVFSLTHVKGVLVPHDVDLIILLAVGFGVALFWLYCRPTTTSPLIGYLIAGIIISPNTRC